MTITQWFQEGISNKIKMYWYNFRLYLVQEFCCGGELFRRMEFERLMLEKDAIFYLSEIVIALEYLHSKVNLTIIIMSIKLLYKIIWCSPQHRCLISLILTGNCISRPQNWKRDARQGRAC